MARKFKTTQVWLALLRALPPQTYLYKDLIALYAQMPEGSDKGLIQYTGPDAALRQLVEAGKWTMKPRSAEGLTSWTKLPETVAAPEPEAPKAHASDAEEVAYLEEQIRLVEGIATRIGLTLESAHA